MPILRDGSYVEADKTDQGMTEEEYKKAVKQVDSFLTRRKNENDRQSPLSLPQEP